AARADRARDDVAAGIARRRSGVELAAVDELLDDRMVDADLLDLPFAQAVRARVTEVDRQPVSIAVDVGDDDAGERGARSRSAPPRQRFDATAGRRECRVHLVDGEARTPGELRELVDHGRARDLAGRVP